MKDMKEMVEKLAYLRLDEIPEEKKSEFRLKDFCGWLEGEEREKLNDILEERISEQDRRERDIYIRGLKDGFVLANFLAG
ncbi:MAG: hypothetical protein LUG24_05700 [Clostridiales bacterium]|nr:hypothetical protein [Clostridiales bacterium]